MPRGPTAVAVAVAVAVAAAALTGCQPASIGAMDEVYYRGPGRRVLCAVGIDTVTRNDLASIEAGLDRARDEGAVVQLYAHEPGRTVPVDTIEAVLAGAAARGLDTLTYDQLADGVAARPGLALSFDDDGVLAWRDLADRFDAHGARVTFFVTRYHAWSDAEKQALHELAGRGHAIGAHSVNHVRAPAYAEDHGLAAYLADEVRPNVDRLRGDGFTVRTFAYPFGTRTAEIDRTLLGELELLRSVSFSYDNLVVTDPCPE